MQAPGFWASKVQRALEVDILRRSGSASVSWLLLEGWAKEIQADALTGKPEARDIDNAVAIYEAYPRKVGRPAALRSILKALKQFPFDFLLERTQTYAKAREGQDETFTPIPTTWFNQHRFNDDAETWKPKITRSIQRPLSVMDIKSILAAKDARCAELKHRHCAEGPLTNEWDDDDAKAEYGRLRKECRGLVVQLSQMA